MGYRYPKTTQRRWSPGFGLKVLTLDMTRRSQVSSRESRDGPEACAVGHRNRNRSAEPSGGLIGPPDTGAGSSSSRTDSWSCDLQEQ